MLPFNWGVKRLRGFLAGSSPACCVPVLHFELQENNVCARLSIFKGTGRSAGQPCATTGQIRQPPPIQGSPPHHARPGFG